MPESYVQVAPDSSGKKLRTRSRAVGANTIEEQYVIAAQTDAVPVNRAWFSSLRVPNPAVAAPTAPAVANVPIFSAWNGIGAGGNNVSIRRLSVEIDSILAHIGAAPILRLYRMSTQAGTPGGTVITPVRQYLADPVLNTLVGIRAAHGTDNVYSALTLGTLDTQPMWSQTMPKVATVVGFQSVNEYNMVPNDSALNAVDPLILRPSEGFAIRLESTIALAVNTWTVTVKAVFAEFTYP